MREMMLVYVKATALHFMLPGANNYSWYPAAGLSATDIANPAASPADSTVYTVTTKDNVSGCTATDSVVVFVYDYPTANAGPDKAIIEGNNVMLTGSVAGTAISYNWTPPAYMNDANSITPVVFPPRDTTYTLHTISSVGCGNATDNVFVKVYKRIDVPNAFSPNHDGINDTWQIPALSAYPDAVVSVFNRYGKAVFTSKGNYSAWNGTYNNSELPIGTYYYVIDPKAAINLPMIKGSVTILR
jgi:gliding motility-associated-like protein